MMIDRTKKNKCAPPVNSSNFNNDTCQKKFDEFLKFDEFPGGACYLSVVHSFIHLFASMTEEIAKKKRGRPTAEEAAKRLRAMTEKKRVRSTTDDDENDEDFVDVDAATTSPVFQSTRTDQPIRLTVATPPPPNSPWYDEILTGVSDPQSKFVYLCESVLIFFYRYR